MESYVVGVDYQLYMRCVTLNLNWFWYLYKLTPNPSKCTQIQIKKMYISMKGECRETIQVQVLLVSITNTLKRCVIYKFKWKGYYNLSSD